MQFENRGSFFFMIIFFSGCFWRLDGGYVIICDEYLWGKRMELRKRFFWEISGDGMV